MFLRNVFRDAYIYSSLRKQRHISSRADTICFRRAQKVSRKIDEWRMVHSCFRIQLLVFPTPLLCLVKMRLRERANAARPHDDRCDKPYPSSRTAYLSATRENIRKYSTCKFIEILRTPAFRREMYSRRSGDTKTKSASLYCHSAPFESIA